MKKNLLIVALVFFIAVFVGCTYFLVNSNHVINFDNEKYILKYSKIMNRGNAILNEYTTEKDSIQKLNKLLSVHYFPNTNQDLNYLANSHIESIKKTYGEQFKILYDKRKGNIIVKSFIIVNREYTEYNATGYTKYKNGYYYLQFMKIYRYSNANELRTESMQLLRENQKYTGLVESKMTNGLPKPLIMDYVE